MDGLQGLCPWGLNPYVSEGGLHPNPNASWLVFSHLRAGHERGARPVDPVNNDRVRDAPAVDRGDGLLLRPAGPARSSLRGFRWE